MTVGSLGFDNIAVAFALGPLQLGWRRVALLGFAFGFAEAGMTLLGAVGFGHLWIPAMTAGDAARAGLLATLAVGILGLAWIKSRPAEIVANPWALVPLSLLLGVDNLIAGRGLEDSGFSVVSIGATGILIGTLAAAACSAGSALFPLGRRSGALLSALMLAGLAVAGIV